MATPTRSERIIYDYVYLHSKLSDKAAAEVMQHVRELVDTVKSQQKEIASLHEALNLRSGGVF